MTSENNTLTIPTGIKITAILLIIVCGIQIIGLLLVMAKMATNTGHGAGLIIIPFVMVSLILPALGMISGIGLIKNKQWTLKYVLGFSKISIALYGVGVLLHIMFDNSVKVLGTVAFIVYGCALPCWCLYYFTRPHIQDLFATRIFRGHNI